MNWETRVQILPADAKEVDKISGHRTSSHKDRGFLNVTYIDRFHDRLILISNLDKNVQILHVKFFKCS